MEKYKNKKIILLATACDFTNIIFGELSTKFTISKIIIENNVSKKILLKNRIKKIGLIKVIGQVLFLLFIAKPMLAFSSRRIKQILESNNLTIAPIPEGKITFVNSVNDKNTLAILKAERPDLIIVNGTRIISNEVLTSFDTKFINIHAGITPLYRGVHGAYWALQKADKENCGVTIHYMDKGIDTGGIVAQEIIYPSTSDNFTTYPYLQFAKGVKLLSKSIELFFDNALVEISPPKGKSNLWYHPTLWEYLFFRLYKGVK